MRPTRSPSTPSVEHVDERRARLGDRRRVHRVVAADRPRAASAASATVVVNGPIWSRLLANAIEAVAADDAVRRLDADDAAQRRRLADRAAGVAAEADGGEPGRDRRRAAAARPARDRGWCRAGCASGRTPSSRCSSPSRTRRGWSCRSTTAPAAAQPLDDRRVVRRLPALEDPRRARRRDAAGAHVVLQRDRHAGQRARVVAGGDGGVDRRGRGRAPRRRAPG